MPITAVPKKISILEDAMCIPAGDELWTKLGVAGDVRTYISKKEILIGPAKIPKGCQITFGYTSELTSNRNLAEIAQKRIVTVLNCPFKMANVEVRTGIFDLEGCLDGYQQIISKKKLCPGTNQNLDIGQYYFDGGFLRCDHKDENN